MSNECDLNRTKTNEWDLNRTIIQKKQQNQERGAIQPRVFMF